MRKKVLAVIIIAVVAIIIFAASTLQAQAPGERADPLTQYKFRIEIDGIVEASFAGIEGLNVTVDVIEFREGGDQGPPKLIPGLPHYGPLVLRNGVTENDELLEWMEKTADGNVERKNLSVIILKPNGVEVVRYNLENAWPSSWSLGKLDGSAAQILVEELIVQYEGFTRSP